MRVQVKEHTIIESHPDNEVADLRLDRPFELLEKYFESINLDEMDVKDHSHTPYVVILYKFLRKWMSEHDKLPSSYKEKESLKEMIREGMRKDEYGNPIDEENFEETIRAVNTSVRQTTVPASVMNILNDERCVNLTAKVIKTIKFIKIALFSNSFIFNFRAVHSGLLRKP